MRYEIPQIGVGIPTYNRPELLERRLENVLSQTWANIAVFVGDNASPDPRVAEVLERFAKQDKRVRHARHDENIGASANFRFVLDKSPGRYFAWASDDDEWDNHYLESCLGSIGGNQLCVGDISTKYLKTGRVDRVPVPLLSPANTAFENAKLFLSNMQPGMLYGLHNRESLRRDLVAADFDFWDMSLVFRAILRDGVVTAPGMNYQAGVPGDEYEAKAFGDGGKFSYHPFVRHGLSDISLSPSLSLVEKLRLSHTFLSTAANLMSHLISAYPRVARRRHHLMAAAYNSPRALKTQIKRAIGR